MKKRTRKIALMGLVVILLVGGFGYYHIFGKTNSVMLANKVHVIYQENLFGQIGAKIVAIDTGSHWVLVDTTLSPFAGGALGEIKGISQQPIELAVITHWHPDHSGGIATFGTEATTVAHENVAKILSRDREGFGLTAPGSTHEFPALSGKDLPNQTFSDQQTFTIDGFAFEVVHYPNAHTDGDSVVFAKDFSVAAVGDLVWPGGFPFVDVHNGGSARGLLAALDAILARVDAGTKIISGHGDPMTKGELAEYRSMVFQTTGFVMAGKASGSSLEDIISAGLPNTYADYASALVPEAEWITMIYNSAP